MFSLRKLVFRPRVDDWAPLAKFFYADEALNTVANELDSLDARRDPERCQQLVAQLRQCQDRVLQIIEEMMCEIFPIETDRAPRDFRVKFPDDILHENLPGQLWFGAECLAAGSNIVDREFESEVIRPLAKVLIQNIDALREALRQQSLKNVYIYPERVRRLMRQFDLVFAEFELNYVSAMVPVKSVREYEMQLDVAVLFSETLIRAIKRGYITQSMIDYCDPNVMITIPRLAIVYGLLLHPDGPLCIEKSAEQLPEMFRTFRSLLRKIRDLLETLSEDELASLERLLSSQENSSSLIDDGTVKLIANYQCGELEKRSSTKDSNNCDIDRTSDTSAGVKSKLIDSAKETESCEYFVKTAQSDSSSDKKSETGNVSDEERENVEQASVSSNSSTAILLMNSAMDGVCANIRTTAGREKCEIGNPDAKITTVIENQLLTKKERLRETKAIILRSRFRSTQDLIHRLFVCIAGVADQWQSNYPSDLRTVLKMVLHPEDDADVYEVNGKPADGNGREEEMGIEVGASPGSTQETEFCNGVPWVPDSECASCSACQAVFTLVRRRHHCRNCGKIYCDRCSRNSAPLPKYGYTKPVRVCNQCFFYKLSPFSTGSGAIAPTSNRQSPFAEGRSGSPSTSG